MSVDKNAAVDAARAAAAQESGSESRPLAEAVASGA
jgi:hypothetical protein